VLALEIEDTFYPENAGRYVIEFNNGYLTYAPASEPEVVLGMDVSEFSSMITCSVSVQRLHRLGRITVSDSSYLKQLDKIFGTAEKPLCMHRF
jgi:predicted acetyltransferase